MGLTLSNIKSSRDHSGIFEKLVIDTNIILYEIKGQLSEQLPPSNVVVSIITKVELLGYPKLGATEEALITDVLNQTQIWPVDDHIAMIAISLRQRQPLKVPDAIIAATAIVL